MDEIGLLIKSVKNLFPAEAKRPALEKYAK